MKSKLAFLVLCLSGLLTIQSATADVTIGNGFSCSGSSVMKAGKLIDYKKAKSNIAQTLTKLRNQLSTAAPKKKAAIRAKIQAANNSKTLLKACSSGQLSPDQVDPIFTQLASGSGTYSGNYSGVIDGFFPISGPVTISFVLDGTNFSALLSLSGNLGSTLNAQPLSFAGDVGGIGFPAQFNLPNTFLGSVTLSVTQDGHLTITNVASNSNVTYDGHFSSTTITSTLSGTYKGHSFSGNATLSRQ